MEAAGNGGYGNAGRRFDGSSDPRLGNDYECSTGNTGSSEVTRSATCDANSLHIAACVTNELPAAHYAKRLTMIDFWLGDADWHTERFAAPA